MCIRDRGYGPAGVAVLCEALTDNRNRTAADVRAAFSHSGGNLGTSGSVAFQFDRKGQIMVSKEVETCLLYTSEEGRRQDGPLAAGGVDFRSLERLRQRCV